MFSIIIFFFLHRIQEGLDPFNSILRIASGTTKNSYVSLELIVSTLLSITYESMTVELLITQMRMKNGIKSGHSS